MHIKDVEQRTGLSRANIRYYEQEGLVHPARRKNGYRDYSPDDLEALLRVRLLRRLDVPIEEIRAMQAGKLSLSEALSQIRGAGEVTVVLTLAGGPRQVLAQDVDQAAERGQERRETVVVSRGSGGQEAVAVQEVSPEYQGALLVCPGGGDPTVRLQLTQAVAALTGLGADKISISEGK